MNFNTALVDIATRAGPLQVPGMTATTLARVATGTVTQRRLVSSHVSYIISYHLSIKGETPCRATLRHAASHVHVSSQTKSDDDCHARTQQLANVHSGDSRFLSQVESNYLSQMLLGRRECTLKRRCFRACTENMLLEVSFSDDRWVEQAHQS